MNSFAAFGCGAEEAIEMPRGVPSMGWLTRAQSSGAGALVTMYFGMEMPISFSPLSIGAGVGPKEATNIGLLAASPLTNFIQASSDLKTFSRSPMSQPMVVGWEVGLPITILPRHLGSVMSSYDLGTSAGFTSSLL